MSKDKAADGKPDDGEEEFVAVEVDDAGKPVGVPDKEDAAGDQDDRDASGSLGDSDDEDDDDDDLGDTRLGHSEEEELTDETPEQRKDRLKKVRRARKIRNRVMAESRERLLANQQKLILDLNERVAKMEGRSVQYDIRSLQQQLHNIELQQTDAKSTYAQLAKAGDGDGLAEVAEIQAQLREQHGQTLQMLQRAKAQSKKEGATTDEPGESGEPRPGTRQRSTPPEIDPEVKIRAEEWAADKPWLNPQKSPEDFAIVRAIDETMVKGGFNPRTDEYWAELTKRVQRRLPERFKKVGAKPNGSNGSSNGGGRRVDNDNSQRPASGGPRMAVQSQSGGGRVLGKNEVRVTPARKEAMIAAGKWDDPVLRNKQLQAYAKYDREHAEG